MATSSQIISIVKDGWDVFLGFSTLLIGIATAIFAGFQYRINQRMKNLEDYVAITIVPIFDRGIYKIQIRNVGRLNIYLHKFEVGDATQNYNNPRLIAPSVETAFIISVPHRIGSEMQVKFYLTDEFGKKYISTGAVIIDPVITPFISPVSEEESTSPLPVERQAIRQVRIQGNIRAWSYRTEPFNWEI